MLNDPRSHGLWEMTAPDAPQTGQLTQHLTADVVIVGAGYTGLSTALHLAEKGVDAVILEAVDIGFGGAGRNVGLVNAGMWVMPEELVTTLGPDLGNRLIDFLGEGPSHVWDIVSRYQIPCEANHVGTLHAGVGAKGFAELQDRARQWQARRAPVRLLDRAEAATMLGTNAYAGALLDERAGTIQPLAYARGLARAAIGQGARIFTRSAATGLQQQGDQWRVSTASGSVTARRVVLATDAYARYLHEDIRNQQVHLPYFNLATEPLPQDVAATIVPGRQGVWDTKEVLLSYRFDARGRLVFGSVGALRGTGVAVHRAWARRTLKKLYPQIGTPKFEAEWYGKIGMTSDNLPRFHKLEEGVFAFCGYNGRGIAPGTTFGRFMAAYLRGDKTDQDLPLQPTAPKPASMRALREAWYEAGAQMVHLVESRF